MSKLLAKVVVLMGMMTMVGVAAPAVASAEIQPPVGATQQTEQPAPAPQTVTTDEIQPPVG